MCPEMNTPAPSGRLVDRTLAPRFALLCLGIWLNAADTLVTATIMPSVAKEIGGYQYFGWSVAAYLTGSIVAGACSGKLAREIHGAGPAHGHAP
jgi:MFS family permease